MDSDAESREVVNQYAKAFVETVRASGGNNPNRCIMVTPYAASSSKQNMELWKFRRATIR